ncbi:HEAT repeat domain-containing protein [Crossiella cryophila]|uniref:HEAT repeat domain-containing protein n=1 Tax=Crossiella cryophila TaxID=43355 RepID=A0A7W7FYG4_9PSEU|nr:HEAT repeat domain-containing protein [Crossiella cryophila]MBB4682085.1 hypothetical protein [Crossiella cryophila]
MIFGDDISRPRVLRVLPGEDEVAAYAAEQEWDPISFRQADPAQGVNYEVVWLTEDNLTLHYRQDYVSRSACFLFAGDDPELAEHLAAEMDTALDAYSVEELIDAATTTTEPPERGRALLRLGFGSPPTADDRILPVITAGLRDPDPDLRRTAIWATTYAPWPQYRAPLAELATGEPVPDVRDLAQATLQILERREQDDT